MATRGAPRQTAAGGGARPGGLPWPELAQGQPGPLYGIFGEEDFLVSQAVEAFIAGPAFLQNPSLNVERFHAAETPPGRILESARTMPFLGSRRLVVVQDVAAYKAERLGEFLPYLADPPPFTTLLFTAAKLDSRTKFAKTLAGVGKVHAFKKMWPREAAGWLKERAAARGKSLAPAAAEQLTELMGLGLGALDSELEKLSLYVGGRRQITPADVAAVTGKGRLYSIFDFTDALAAGRLDRALTAYDQLDALGEPAVRVLAMVTRLFRQLLEARAVLDQGGGPEAVQSALRLPPSAVRSLSERAGRESAKSLAGRLKRILAADLALKSSPGSDRVIMERLVLDLCAKPARAA
ncbi:MAG: DNA polymerase III subunit delta [Thermodesulfobacteriota bacterium]